MKKRFAIVFALALTVCLLASCGAGMSATEDMMNTVVEPSANKSASTNGTYDMYVDAMEAPMASDGVYFGGNGMNYDSGSTVNTTSDASNYSEKMIYTASATVETTEFEESIQAVYDMVENYGGFLESSYITGQRYRYQWENYTPNRTATFTIRVPAEGFSSMKSNLSVIGNVVDIRDWAENITEQYYDTESRLETYRIEQERVLAMLEKADNVSDMLELESRLSEIRYNIESLESRLRNWQKQVDYSTVNLTIEEVAKLTPVETEKRTYWQRMGDEFMQSIDDIGYNISEFFIDFVAALPGILIFAVIVLVIVLIVKAIVRRRKAKKEKLFREQQAAFENKNNVV